MIDQYYNYEFGKLEYRSLKFDTEVINEKNYQGNAVVNYTDIEVDYTRIIEHKHFEFGTQDKTVVTKEYPKNWKIGDQPYYPVNDSKNNLLLTKYQNLNKNNPDVIFGGRLGLYKYMDMDDVIESALNAIETNII
jgi:UDP-galactopyranose mutase